MEHIKKGRKGFTLIELLVVIAIVALLVSILLPAVNKVKMQAKTVVCRSNLRQWGFIWDNYTSENDFSWPTGEPTAPSGWVNGQWVEADIGLAPNDEIFFCPTTTVTETEKGPGFRGREYVAWWRPGPYVESAGHCVEPGYTQYSPYHGSYGFNNWLYNPSPGVTALKGNPTRKNWRYCNVDGAGYIPVFMDSWWQGGFPNSSSEPTPYNGWTGEDRENEMKYFCTNHHGGYLNCLFMDWSTRKVAIKNLWDLKWHNEYDLRAPDPIWPAWMENLPED